MCIKHTHTHIHTFKKPHISNICLYILAAPQRSINEGGVEVIVEDELPVPGIGDDKRSGRKLLNNPRTADETNDGVAVQPVFDVIKLFVSVAGDVDK